MIAILDTLFQKSMLICVIYDINQVVPAKNSHQIYILTAFLVNLVVQIQKGVYEPFECNKAMTQQQS